MHRLLPKDKGVDRGRECAREEGSTPAQPLWSNGPQGGGVDVVTQRWSGLSHRRQVLPCARPVREYQSSAHKPHSAGRRWKDTVSL